MYYRPPPPRPHGGESPDHTKQAPSGSVMPEGACRGRRTGHGAGKLDKNVLAALRGADSGPSNPWARVVALTPRVPLCVPEPFQPRHAARQQVGAGELEQKRQAFVAGPDGRRLGARLHHGGVPLRPRPPVRLQLQSRQPDLADADLEASARSTQGGSSARRRMSASSRSRGVMPCSFPPGVSSCGRSTTPAARP